MSRLMAVYRAKRSAFTLIEFLAVIGIVLILLALLLPAVQEARTAAGRLGCSNRLRQTALALHHHNDAHQLLPHNGGWDASAWIEGTDGRRVYMATNEFRWGVGRPDARPIDQPGSWAYAVLPYLEQEPIFERRSWGTALELYICPLRPPAVAQVPADDAHGRYEGGGWAWAKTDYAANGLVIPNRPGQLALGNVHDGLSNTVLLGEKGLDASYYNAPGWYFDEPYFLGGSHGTIRTGSGLRRDRLGDISTNRWGSAHPHAASFALSDASVRQFSYGMERGLLRSLLTPSGGEAVAAH